MLDGIAIIIQALAWVGLVTLCLRRGKEIEELKKQLDIKVMEIQSLKKE